MIISFKLTKLWKLVLRKEVTFLLQVSGSLFLKFGSTFSEHWFWITGWLYTTLAPWCWSWAAPGWPASSLVARCSAPLQSEPAHTHSSGKLFLTLLIPLPTFPLHLLLHFLQCCGSVTFWNVSGAGFAEPYQWVVTYGYGFGSGSCFSCQWLTRCQQKISFCLQGFFAYYFLKVYKNKFS
jgi:hypothetical protein